VPGANLILAKYGLQLVDKDYATKTAVTVHSDDPLARNVHQLRFWRPALIRTTNASQCTILAPAPTRESGFVAVCRPAGGGEVMVLGESLWFNWPNQTNSDNAVMLGNLLTGSATLSTIAPRSEGAKLR